MGIYQCKNCGYHGSELIFQFNDYGYCLASNDEAPNYLNGAPEWVRERCFGEAEIGDPVGCPVCRTWGVYNFEKIGDLQTA